MEEQFLNKCFPEGEKCQGRENAGYVSRGAFDFSLRTVSPPEGHCAYKDPGKAGDDINNKFLNLF